MEGLIRFCVERHLIWEKRQAGLPPPWTDDPVLATRKFTNVFRILDPGSQFVLTDLADPDLSERDQLMRLFFYRHTGRVESWQWIELALGRYPTVEDLGLALEALKDYRGDNARPVSTNAYKIYPQSQNPGTDRLDAIVDLVQRLFTPGSPQDVIPDWERATTQEQRFGLLRRNKGVGDFMSMQVLADWGYLQDEDLEDEFLVPGPGSLNGAKAIDPDARPRDTVRRAIEAVRGVADCPRLGYRTPSSMDIGSNLLCEYSKYVRFQGQAVPTRPYAPAHPGPQPVPVLPSYYETSLI